MKLLALLLALLCTSCATISEFNPEGLEEARPIVRDQ
jgi:hypothetical protein